MKTIFEEIRLGSLTLKNRLVRSATWEGMATEDGHMTEPLFKVYENLAKGGVGLIITGYSYILAEEHPNPNMMGIYDDAFVDEYKPLTSMIHGHDCKVVMQIVYGGSCTPLPAQGRIIWSPSGVTDLGTGVTPSEMTQANIHTVIQAFGDAAVRAKAAGFDGVQFHGAHGYLLSQFMTPYYNRRTDEYGGSLENRARIILEVYDEVRRRVGEDYPVMIKINGEDYIDGGTTLADSMQLAKMLDEKGIDAIEVSGGVASAGKKIPPRPKINSPEKEAYHVANATKIAKEIAAPVMVVGGGRTPDVIEKSLNESEIVCFCLARPLVSEPNLPNRWLSGDRTKARCISCNACLAYIEGKPWCALDRQQ